MQRKTVSDRFARRGNTALPTVGRYLKTKIRRHLEKVGGTRLEQTSSLPENLRSQLASDAQNDAQRNELVLIIDQWPTLPTSTREKILKLVGGNPLGNDKDN